MKYLILPGFSEKNKQWAHELRDGLESHEINSAVIEWEHWRSKEESDFDFKREGEKVIKEIDNSEVGIIAKSVGSILTTRLLKSIPQRIIKIVLMGIPLNSLTEADRENFSVLKNFPAENILVFQNSQDPYGSFREVRKFIEEINKKIKVVVLLREDHKYFVNQTLLDFLKEEQILFSCSFISFPCRKNFF